MVRGSINGDSLYCVEQSGTTDSFFNDVETLVSEGEAICIFEDLDDAEGFCERFELTLTMLAD